MGLYIVMSGVSSTGPKALLFDLGGVVIDVSFDAVFRSWASAAGCDVEEIRSRFRFGADYEAHERGEIEHGEYFASLRRDLGIDLSDEEFSVGWMAIFGGVIPGMAALLRRAAECLPCYVLTNSNRLHETLWARRFAEALRPMKRIFNSATIGARKPEERAFRIVADGIGVALEDIVFYDDAEENIAGARRLGMRAVLVRSIEDVRGSLDDLC